MGNSPLTRYPILSDSYPDSLRSALLLVSVSSSLSGIYGRSARFSNRSMAKNIPPAMTASAMSTTQ